MPVKKPKKILALFDIPWPATSRSELSHILNATDWKDEKNVINALKRLGHEVEAFGVFDDIYPLLEKVQNCKPGLIFNMCESFNHCRNLESNLIGLFELMGIPYTGAGPEASSLCKDKGMTKQILSCHGISVPGFLVSTKNNPLKKISKIQFPCIVKPLSSEASEGIAENSRVLNSKDCLARVTYIHKKLNQDAIIEEYIEGRELYVGVLGNRKLNVFPPMELYFKKVPKDKPKFLTHKGKWDQKFRKKWGIDSSSAKFIEAKTLTEIKRISKIIYQAFKLKGYARIDLRLTATGEIVFLEINPNPSIARIDDFAQGAKQHGIAYDDLISKIVRLGLAA